MERLAGQTRQLLFIARGTSDNAAVYGRYLVEAHTGRLSTLAAPSIATTYRRKLDLDGVLAVGLSQSGRTEEIVETLAWAGECGAKTVAITNGGEGARWPRPRISPCARSRARRRPSRPPRPTPRSSPRWPCSPSAWAPTWTPPTCGASPRPWTS
nr:hypothetical protein GCM10020093_093380 [Planobispora longispora]